MSAARSAPVVGRFGRRGYAAYGTAKAAVAHHTRRAAADLSPGIRVDCVSLGSVLTSALDVVARNESIKSATEAATPPHRIGDPQDASAAVLYLCAPAGPYLPGTIHEVDGGLRTPNLDFGLPDR